MSHFRRHQNTGLMKDGTEEVQNVDMDRSLAVFNPRVEEILSLILTQLKIMNTHMETITGNEYTLDEIEGDE